MKLEGSKAKIAEKILDITNRLEIPFVFKGSFKKANRSRIDSFTGIGDEKALNILKKIGEKLQIPTVTDIHEVKDANLAANYVDVLQIPAFLIRQTDLLSAAAKTGKHINLKKGQFMSPESMFYAVKKIQDSGNDNVIITERGSMFGYQDLLVDFRGIPVMKKLKEKEPFYASIYKRNFLKSGKSVKINKATLGIELEVCYKIKKSFFSFTCFEMYCILLFLLVYH